VDPDIQDSGSDISVRSRIFSFNKASQVDLRVNHYRYPLLKYIKNRIKNNNIRTEFRMNMVFQIRTGQSSGTVSTTKVHTAKGGY
jgi:hypothetical protein